MILIQSLAGYYNPVSLIMILYFFFLMYNAFYVNKGHKYKISTFTNNDNITKLGVYDCMDRHIRHICQILIIIVLIN